jgi:hypothetical protein
MSQSRFSLPREKDEPKVDPDALRAFAAGAKEHRTDQQPPPWEQHVPDEIPRHNVSVRLNDYQLEMLRYVAKRSDMSQQKVLNRILLPAIEEQAKELYER